MYLSRTKYLNKIKIYLNKQFIKVITWQRRVWKTTLMNQIMKFLDKKLIVQINMEQKEFDRIFSDDELNKLLEDNIKKWKKYLFIDEIQQIKNREKSINSIFSKYQNQVDIFISWSNSNLLSSELATLLAGRFVQFQVLPFSFYEFAEFFDKNIWNDSFQDYLNVWWLPSVYQLNNNDELVWERIKNLKDTIFLKDIVWRYKIKDVFLLEDIFLFLVNNIWNLTSFTNILKYLETKGIKANLNTIDSYVQAMKNSFLVYEASLYDLQWKMVFDRERKFYISDHILRKYLFSGYEKWLSKILENIVYMECIRNWYGVFVGRIKDKEIDFIIEKQGIKKYIQVTYLLSNEDVVQREFGNLKLIKDNREKYVLSLDNINFGIIDGIKHIQVWNMKDIF